MKIILLLLIKILKLKSTKMTKTDKKKFSKQTKNNKFKQHQGNKNNSNSIAFSSLNDFLRYFDIEQIIVSKYFNEAITHSSVSKKKNYERLEFLGDTILNFCVSKMLFNLFPNDREGELSKKKSYLITRKVCLYVAYAIHLNDKIKFLDNGTINQDNILPDIVESLICVIYQTYGIDVVYNIIYELFSQHINDIEVEDPKMRLQEYTQKYLNCLPTYNVIKKEGTENEPIFTIEVCVNHKTKQYKTIGVGKNKKIAEKECAKKMLEFFKNKNNH